MYACNYIYIYWIILRLWRVLWVLCILVGHLATCHTASSGQWFSWSNSGYEVWRTVGWPQDPQVLNEVWLRSVQNISRRFSDLPKISNKLTMSKTAQAGNWCLDLYHRLSVPRGECSTEGFACWELWEFVITCTTRWEASASVRTLLWHVCLTHLSTCLSTRLCRLVIWKHKTQPDGQHEVMAKSQKLSNLSKQSRTVAQSASCRIPHETVRKLQTHRGTQGLPRCQWYR